jgi:hypothetical protein
MAGTILSADDAASIIAADYQTYLGRAADVTAFGSWWLALMNGMPQATFIAASTEAQSAIAGLYQTVLGRTASSAEIAGWQATLAATSLQTIRTDFANSAEAQPDIAALYQTMLGRAGSSAEGAAWQATLTTTSLQTIRTSFAESHEAQADITAMYQNILGRTPAASEVAAWQNVLANSRLQSVQSAIADSPEANADIASLYQQVLGRSASASEIAVWQNVLTVSSLQTVRASMAANPEAQADLSADYAQFFGQPSAVELSSLTSQLASGGSLNQINDGLAAIWNDGYGGVITISTPVISYPIFVPGTVVSDTIAPPANPSDTLTIQLTPDTLGLLPSFVVKLDGQQLGEVSVGVATSPGSPVSASFSGDWGLSAHVLELAYTGSQSTGAADPVQVQAISFIHSVAGTTTAYGYDDAATLDPTNPSVQFAVGTQAGTTIIGTSGASLLGAGSIILAPTISPATAVTLTDASIAEPLIIASGNIGAFLPLQPILLS